MSAAPVGNFYIYSFDGKLLQVYDIYGTLLKDFVYMGSRLVAEYDHANSRIFYYTPDQINSTRVATDAVGNAVYSATYDPYGNVRTETGSINPMLKFSGKEHDAESQLDYFGARYYDPSQYRFITVDPIAHVDPRSNYTGQLNSYQFCWNNSVTFFEPDGSSPQKTNPELRIIRYQYGSNMTRGLWITDNSWSGSTLELPWNNDKRDISCIPEGTYTASLFWSTKRKAWTLLLENTGKRTLIEIHPGNITDDTRGCILPGIGTTRGGIKNSKTAWGLVMEWFFSYWWDEINEDIKEGIAPFSNKKGVVIIESVDIR